MNLHRAFSLRALVWLGAVTCLTSGAFAETTANKPNILVIFGDDIGWMNVSSYGGDVMGVATPNIDRIGKEGLRLSAFYAQPSCTAGRAAFITGQLPVRIGLTTVGTTGAPAGLQKEDITLAEVLKTKGYATAQFGKNHLGDLEEHLPHRHGFDEFFGSLYHLNANEDLEDPDRPTNPEFRKKFDPRGVISGTADGPTKDEGPLTTKRMETFDDEILDHSLNFLDRRAKDSKPFFLWHNTTRQHVFIHLGEKHRGVSRAGIEDVYGDGLAEHDAQIGKLLKKLDDSGLAKNTIVIYTTDNGAYQYMWPEGGTSPFRGDKGTTWEGGVRVPFVVRWPGAPAGRVSGEIVDMTDLFPTLARAAGAPDVVEKLKAGANYGDRTYKVHLDGFDQTALFAGEADKSSRKFIFYYDETILTAIRYQQFKFTFSEKEGGHWDDPLLNLGRPRITNLLSDPFERQTGNVNRQMNEHKAWSLTPILGVMQQHLASFQQFPVRQVGLSANIGKTIEGIQSQLLKVQSHD
ncbi:sulfatase-like hydrolase/transferase [Rhodoblastus acidophilus]|uniref:Sulfatase-like hydrolase/transferase n=1 Tax=Rhodoblastus acidophilus TaxID=1074 RepID=A0A6N8DUN7_RHOAC|nr:arylsulfatase [Rhodoblastus acidophilus]MCW2276511.1 arylsulfatase [Rhodoblastus acidophilus]MTV33305.1 sulfatase-like hydrolase/transferase [Rhodoblastus acidophilus]